MKLRNNYTFNAKVTRVVDGDTIDAIVDLGFNIFTKVRFRMLDYDSPETYRPKSAEEKRLGLLATAAMKDFVDGKDVLIKSNKFGKYRWLGTVYLKGDGVSVNQKMIDLGHIK